MKLGLDLTDKHEKKHKKKEMKRGKIIESETHRLFSAQKNKLFCVEAIDDVDTFHFSGEAINKLCKTLNIQFGKGVRNEALFAKINDLQEFYDRYESSEAKINTSDLPLEKTDLKKFLAKVEEAEELIEELGSRVNFG